MTSLSVATSRSGNDVTVEVTLTGSGLGGSLTIYRCPVEPPMPPRVPDGAQPLRNATRRPITGSIDVVDREIPQGTSWHYLAVLEPNVSPWSDSSNLMTRDQSLMSTTAGWQPRTNATEGTELFGAEDAENELSLKYTATAAGTTVAAQTVTDYVNLDYLAGYTGNISIFPIPGIVAVRGRLRLAEMTTPPTEVTVHDGPWRSLTAGQWNQLTEYFTAAGTRKGRLVVEVQALSGNIAINTGYLIDRAGIAKGVWYPAWAPGGEIIPGLVQGYDYAQMPGDPVDLGSDWLYSCKRGTIGNGVAVTVNAAFDKDTEVPADIEYVIDRADGVASFGNVRRSWTGKLALVTADAASTAALELMLETSPVVALAARSPSAYGVSPLEYLQVSKLTQRRVSRLGREPARLWEMTVTRISPPPETTS